MKKLSLLGVALACIALSTVTVPADDSAPKPIVADPLAVNGKHPAGSPLAGAVTETGDSPWAAIGKIVFRSDGGVTVGDSGAAATAIVGLNSYDASKTIRVEADLNPAGSGHAALGFVSTLSPGDFWDTVVLFTTLEPNGNVQIFSNKVANKLFSADASAYDFKATGYNHVALTYNPTTQTVSLSVNGKQLAKDVAVITPPSAILGVALHFNEQITANQPGAKNVQVFVLP